MISTASLASIIQYCHLKILTSVLYHQSLVNREVVGSNFLASSDIEAISVISLPLNHFETIRVCIESALVVYVKALPVNSNFCAVLRIRNSRKVNIKLNLF
jgi:hypothetical protein